MLAGLSVACDDPLRSPQAEADEQARLHKEAASEALRLGDESTAADEYAAALSLFRESGNDLDQAKCEYGLFYLNWRSSDLGSALVHADGAVSAARRAGDLELESKALRGLLALQVDLGDLPGAWRTLEAGRPAGREGVVAASARARLLVVEGTLQANEGRLALAVDAFRRALDTASGDEEPAFFRSVHLNLAASHLELDQLELAEQELDRAGEFLDNEGDGSEVPTAIWFHRAELELRRGMAQQALASLEKALATEPVADWRWQIDELRGRALAALGRTAQAEEAYVGALETVEALRADLDFGELRSWLLDAKRRPYERLFELQVGEGRFVEAVATVERAKARSFLDAFVQSTLPEAGAPASETARRLAGLQDLLPGLTAAPISRLEPMDRVLEATADLDVLMYFRTPAALWAITVYHGRPEISWLSEGGAALDEAIDAWLAQPDSDEVGQALSDLILPERLLPEAGRRLYVVADGRLGEVSLAALPVAGEPLILRHELVYTPGLNALAALREAGTGRRETSTSPPVVLGDPLDDLPAARREAVQVAGRLGVAAHLGSEVRSDLLRWNTAAGPPLLLHVASHVGSGAEGPWIALADGRLSAAEVLTLGMGRSAPRLVVLAGCAGAARRGSGLWGSAAAGFLAAGSGAVLASLWSVDDAWALEFIERFYAEGGVRDPAAATALAQRYFLEQGEPPSHWAPFVLLGGPLEGGPLEIMTPNGAE